MHMRILGVALYNRPPCIDVPSIDDIAVTRGIVGRELE